MYSMYSPTLLESSPNQLIGFPRHVGFNFFIWANPDNIVHRYDRGLKSWQTKISTEEHMNEPIDQYGSNKLEDFSHLDPRIENLPLALPILESELPSPS